MKAQAPTWPPPMTSTGRTSPELTAPPQSHCSFVSRGLARLAAYDLPGPCRIDRAGRLVDAPFGFDGRRARSMGTKFGTARSNGHRTLQMIGDTGRGPPIPMTAQAPIWSPPMKVDKARLARTDRPPQSHCSFFTRGLHRLAAHEWRGPCCIDRAGRLGRAPFGFDGCAFSIGARFGTAHS
jgi:hypothetical protein